MGDSKKISNLQKIDEITSETEFVIIDKSIVAGEDASDSGKTTKVSFGKISDSIEDSFVSYGTKGFTGDQGLDGLKGQKGEKGATGSKGALGQRGYFGLTGNAGDSGQTGVAGESGEKGNTGELGNRGTKGSKGPRGDSGEAGPRGSSGQTGLKGIMGQTGDVGVTGETGDKGNKTQLIKGQKGHTGVKGYGRKGDIGERGSRGISGERGNKGSKGFPGVAKTALMVASDLEGNEWTPGVTDQLYLNIQEEMNKQTSRTLIKIKKGRYYDRFILNKDAYAELGMQLYDPLRNSATPLQQYIFDNVPEILRPMIITTEEQRKVATIGASKKIIYYNYISVRVFFENEFRRIPFSTWDSDVF